MKIILTDIHGMKSVLKVHSMNFTPVFRTNISYLFENFCGTKAGMTEHASCSRTYLLTCSCSHTKNRTRTKNILNTENENRTRTKKYACSSIPGPKSIDGFLTGLYKFHGLDEYKFPIYKHTRIWLRSFGIYES